MFISNIKEKIFLVISVVLIIMIFLDIAISFYNFSFYPTIIELLDTIIFTAYCFSKKNQNNLEIFSKNLFIKDLRNFNPNDIY